MPPARRVQLVPPASWDEARIVEAVRAIAAGGGPVRPGDAIGELVVLGVEPEPGATVGDATEVEIVPHARRGDAPLVDVAVLLDVSESMSLPWDAHRTRLQAARASLEAFLRAPGPAVASVVVHEYAKDARIVAGPAPPASVTLPLAPKPKGRSATGSALNAALAELASRSSRERSQAILLLTDGVGELPELRAAAARASRLLVPIHALVFAPEVDEVIEDVARESGGSAQRAGLPLTIEFVHAGESRS